MGRRLVSLIFLFAMGFSLDPIHEVAGQDRGTTGPRRSQGKIIGSLHLFKGESEIPQMITVTLSTMGGNYLQRITLNQELNFRFYNVANGNYVITVESTGYQTVESPVEVTSYMSGEETFVNLTLGRRLDSAEGDRLPPSGRATVTTQSLMVPEKARRELARAQTESKRNNPEKAIQHLNNALEIEPNLPEAYNNLAVEYLKMGRSEDAVTSLQQSIELQPEEAAAHRNLAQVYLSTGQLDQAISALHTSLEHAPMNSRSLRLLGDAYLAKQQFRVALTYFQSASRQNPEDHSHLGLGWCHLHLGQFQEALAELKQFLAREKGDPRAPQIQQIVSKIESGDIN